jgi:hypothetical protein
MTRPELRKLDRIIAQIEKLRDGMDDMVSQQQIADAGRGLLALYNTAKAACDATERA